MTVNRRQLFWSALLYGPAAAAQNPAEAAAANGLTLSEERLRLIKPIVDRRRAQLQALRDFPIDDSTLPRHGF